MAQPIHSDPEHLRQVVEEMTRFAGDLALQMDELEQSLAALGRSWEDEQFDDFRELVMHTMQPVKTLHEQVKTHRKQMESDIDLLEDYQKARIEK